MFCEICVVNQGQDTAVGFSVTARPVKNFTSGTIRNKFCGGKEAQDEIECVYSGKEIHERGLLWRSLLSIQT